MPLIRLGPPCFPAELPVYSGRFYQPFPRGGWLTFAPIRSARDHSNSPTQKPGYAEGNEKMRLQILTLAAAMTVLAACDTTKPADNSGAAGVSQGTTQGGVALSVVDQWKQTVGDRIFFDF